MFTHSATIATSALLPPSPLLAAGAGSNSVSAQVTSGAIANVVKVTSAQTNVSGTNESQSNDASTPFLAQLFSQNNNSQANEDSQIALTALPSHFSPAPTYNTFVSYSVVKYRPSDAGLSASLSSSSIDDIA